MTAVRLKTLFCSLLRYLNLFIFLAAPMISIRCGRRDTSLISKRIEDYTTKNCKPAVPCKIPENVYFYQDDFDRITIMEGVHEISSISKAAGLLNGNLEGYISTDTIKGHRVWVLSKGYTFARLFKEAELYYNDISYPLLINWPENDLNTDEPRFLNIRKGLTTIYATLKLDSHNIMRPEIIINNR